MERKIGDVFNYQGIQLTVVEQTNTLEPCKGCYFQTRYHTCRGIDGNVTGKCKLERRTDGKNVFFTAAYFAAPPETPQQTETRSYNVGASDYSKHRIQPWDIWIEYGLNPFDADIVKRVLRRKAGEDRVTDYKKIIHICQERIRQLQAGDDPFGKDDK